MLHSVLVLAQQAVPHLFAVSPILVSKNLVHPVLLADEPDYRRGRFLKLDELFKAIQAQIIIMDVIVPVGHPLVITRLNLNEGALAPKFFSDLTKFHIKMVFDAKIGRILTKGHSDSIF